MIRKLEKWSCWTSEDVFLWNCMKAKLEHHHQWSPDQPGCRKNLESSARCSVLRGSQHAPRCQTCISGQQLLSEKVKIPCWPVLSQSGHTHIGVIKPQRYGADPQLDHFEPEQWSCFPMIKNNVVVEPQHVPTPTFPPGFSNHGRNTPICQQTVMKSC